MDLVNSIYGFFLEGKRMLSVDTEFHAFYVAERRHRS
jgi:hypothetical protein